MSDNVDYLINYHHGNRPDAITPYQHCSLLLSKALDCLGYNHDMVKYRVAHWKMQDGISNIKIIQDDALYIITAGSQAEGVVTYYGSDIDIMFVNRHAICTDTPYLIIGNRKLTIFQTVNHDTTPGYTKLILFKMGHSKWVKEIQESLLLSEYGYSYLSSDLYTKALMPSSNDWNRKHTSKTLTKSGPALPFYSQSTPEILHDLVHAITCHCPALLQPWLKRPRRHNWPPRNVLYDISKLDAHVVPVGFKGSDTYNQEWRICFTKAETHLIHCLNDTQTKMYIVLKMISKHVLKSLCSEVSSYIMKNIVLWICEFCQSDLLINSHLWCLISQALVFLKKCVTQNYLPSYMITERNLLNGRIEPEEKLKLTETLTMLIEEGPPAVFKRINKLCDAMLFVHRAPKMADYYQAKRELVDKLFLLLNIRRLTLKQPHMSDVENKQICQGDELYGTLAKALWNLALPEWRTLLFRGVDHVSTIIENKLKTFLSYEGHSGISDYDFIKDTSQPILNTNFV